MASASARLIAMRVVQQDRLDVGHLEAQGFDVLLHQVGGISEAHAEQDVALRRRQQVSLSVRHAHEVEVAHDLERIGGRLGVGDLLAHVQR